MIKMVRLKYRVEKTLVNYLFTRVCGPDGINLDSNLSEIVRHCPSYIVKSQISLDKFRLSRTLTGAQHFDKHFDATFVSHII